MSATSQAAGSGAVIGIALVFLLQQFGVLALSDLVTSVVLVVVAAVVGGVICGLGARRAGRRPARPGKG
jgi:ABC-type Fe3+ transport system permease subunit